jgi:dienelactone hydrolase
MMWRFSTIGAVGLATLCAVITLEAADQPLPGTKPLTEEQPLDEVMVAGIDRFALHEIEIAREQRISQWSTDFSDPDAHEESLAPFREQFAKWIGVVDERVAATGIEFIATSEQPSLVAENDLFTAHAVRWPVLEGITAEGIFLQPKKPAIARVIALPDADWTPEMIVGLETCDSRFAADLAAMGCEVLVPTLINRDDKFSANPSIGRKTNLTHREFIYRQAFELGRHVIGYEVQKTLAAVDQFSLRNTEHGDLPIAVVGVSEGGLLALYSAALDTRIDAAVVSGYFDSREQVWREPIYRNVWGLLSKYGDAEIAGLIAPRSLSIESSPDIPEVLGPPETGGRNVAAPGAIKRLDPRSVAVECKRALRHWERMQPWADGRFTVLDGSDSGDSGGPPLDFKVIRRVVKEITKSLPAAPDQLAIGPDRRSGFSNDDRQRRQVDEMVRFTQRLLRLSHRERDERFAVIDRSSAEAWAESSKPVRQQVYAELIGKLPDPTIDPNPRSRQILTEEDYTGYEVVLDVYPDVIAAGILLLPNDLKPGEKRPVVVCQHGLEGTPMDTISGPESGGYRAYKSFSAELVKRGFIVYAPQNPYRGRDAFRTLQRKSNPLGRSLFSYIIPQHLVTLRWLATLPEVDKDRIGFYGLSYGGKTAVRVPPMLPPTETDPGYCLSICSADFNEWVSKNASTDVPFSYVWTAEYEIFEWNMGHVANYAELSKLMAPRPFMVERGHDDGVGIDEWVAWEFAKVRRHYNKLGLGERTEIEFFDGPHTINGQATYRFLHRHLDWPE